MGWSFGFGKPRSVRDEIAGLCTWDNKHGKAEPIFITRRGSIWYAAVRSTPSPSGSHDAGKFEYTLDEDGSYVFAAVFLTRTDSGDWGYKGMDEAMGPVESGAPLKLLDMLSETTSQSALNWRQRCRDNAAWQRKREKLADGDVVRFKQVISFTNGHNQDTFAVVIRDPSECGHRRRRTFFKCVDSGFLCRITGYTMRKYQIVSKGGA